MPCYRRGQGVPSTTFYYYSNPQIANDKEFELSDSEYDAFVKWLDSKHYEYTTEVEASMKNLIENAMKEQYYADIKDEIDDLNGTIENHKGNDLYINKDQIKHLLEESIASRYYSLDGEIEASFNNDADINAAIEVISNPIEYQKILSPSIKE